MYTDFVFVIFNALLFGHGLQIWSCFSSRVHVGNLPMPQFADPDSGWGPEFVE